MDLEELRAFLAVAERGSFLSAATNLGLPRATLRRRIDALEARTGVPLLNRTPRGAALTQAGVLLAARGKRLLADSAALLAAAREAGRARAAPLRMLFELGLPPKLVADLVVLGRDLAPDLRLTICARAAPTDGVVDDADMIVHFGDTPPPGRWVSKPLGGGAVRVLASPRYLQRRGRPTRAEELGDHPLAAWSGPGIDPHRWPRRGAAAVEVTPAVVANDAHLLRQICAQGFGLALVPDSDLEEYGIPTDDLVPVLAEEIAAPITVSMSIPEALIGDARVEQGAALIRDFVGRSPPP